MEPNNSVQVDVLLWKACSCFSLNVFSEELNSSILTSSSPVITIVDGLGREFKPPSAGKREVRRTDCKRTTRNPGYKSFISLLLESTKRRNHGVIWTHLRIVVFEEIGDNLQDLFRRIICGEIRQTAAHPIIKPSLDTFFRYFNLECPKWHLKMIYVITWDWVDIVNEKMHSNSSSYTRISHVRS